MKDHSFCDKYYEYVYKYIFCLSHDTEFTKELTQTTFLKAIQAIDKYDGSCKITTWLKAQCQAL